VIPAASGDELVLNTSEAIEAFDPGNRHIDLATERPEPASPSRCPCITPGVIYASRDYRSGPYAAIRIGGRGDIASSHVLWKVPTGASYISSLVYHNGLLYMAADVGVVTAIDAKTGERVWQGAPRRRLHRVAGARRRQDLSGERVGRDDRPASGQQSRRDRAQLDRGTPAEAWNFFVKIPKSDPNWKDLKTRRTRPTN
jgi:hypothetical protein